MQRHTFGLPVLSWDARESLPENHFDRARLVRQTNQGFLGSVLGADREVVHVSRTSMATLSERKYAIPGASLLVQNAHQCFDGHVGIRLSPVVFMDLIVRELACVIRSEPARYAHLFTTQPGEKTIIRIRNDDVLFDSAAWKDALQQFYMPLREAITKETYDLFAPQFSTLTEEDAVAQLVALMDAASPYYDFRVFSKCGIPLFELDGTVDDWRLLVDHVTQLSYLFPDLEAYFGALVPVLHEVAATAATGDWDEEFWTSFYKWKSGSGGETADGWINVLFAHFFTAIGPQRKTQEQFGWRKSIRYGYDWGGTMINLFPSGLSQVPFTWEIRTGTTSQDVPMHFVAGALGIEETQTGTLEARLGYAIARA